MGCLNCEQILKADDMKIEKVMIPEWKDKDGEGGWVYVRTLTSEERDTYELSAHNESALRKNLRAKLAVMICCDESGSRIFKTDQMAVALGKKVASALDRILEAGNRLNFMDNESLDGLEKNSESSRSEDSGLNSPSELDAPSGNSKGECLAASSVNG